MNVFFYFSTFSHFDIECRKLSSALKEKLDSADRQIVTVCNVENIGKINVDWQVCKCKHQKVVTNCWAVDDDYSWRPTGVACSYTSVNWCYFE